ncbi:MAG: glycosyl transferase family 1 [Eubacterium sp.]|nr:glycosyl transferase family 1 [Eubacterium sp.]
MPRAAWVLPYEIENSGGFRTVFQHIGCLLEHGYQCDVYAPADLKRTVERYFGVYGCRYFTGYRFRCRYDIVFATSWKTAEIVKKYPRAIKKAYFIQDFEASFYPLGTEYLSACNSYCQGLYPITIGRWLARKMIREYHASAQYFDFCADVQVYKNLWKKREKAVCFIYQPHKPRRCSEIGLRALEIVRSMRPDVKIYLYGSDRKPHIPFACEKLGCLSVRQCNALYNRCMVGLCISATNPSRIPFEMMAAGLPVVDVYLENNRYDMPQEGVLLAHYTPQSIAAALLTVLDDQKKAESMSQYGQRYMADRTLQHGYEQFYQAVTNILSDAEWTCREPDRVYETAPVYGEKIERQIPPEVLRRLNSSEINHTLAGTLKQVRLLRSSRILRCIYRQLRGY